MLHWSLVQSDLSQVVLDKITGVQSSAPTFPLNRAQWFTVFLYATSSKISQRLSLSGTCREGLVKISAHFVAYSSMTFYLFFCTSTL